jgi:hypothetical protein
LIEINLELVVLGVEFQIRAAQVGVLDSSLNPIFSCTAQKSDARGRIDEREPRAS